MFTLIACVASTPFEQADAQSTPPASPVLVANDPVQTPTHELARLERQSAEIKLTAEFLKEFMYADIQLTGQQKRWSKVLGPVWIDYQTAAEQAKLASQLASTSVGIEREDWVALTRSALETASAKQAQVQGLILRDVVGLKDQHTLKDFGVDF
jgi:hypothetical protein